MKYLMGSAYFFKNIPGYSSHDVDWIELTDDPTIARVRTIRGQGLDVFFLRRKPKETLIAEALASPLPMAVGKFLIPEFCGEIGFTIEDLPKVRPLIDALDPRHRYEEIIYDSYMENGSFTLTEEQRMRAYKAYLEARAGDQIKEDSI
jgi:hypothetical protein